MNSAAIRRFWAKVNKDGPIPPHKPDLGPCWIWTASKKGGGYGQFAIRKGFLVGAHRVAWELEFGSVPEKLFVLHRCDNTACVNPNHLFLGTQADNMRDCLSKGRHHFISHPGSANGRTRLIDDDIFEIRKLLDDGLKQTQVAAIFGVTKLVISRIHRRVTWSYL